MQAYFGFDGVFRDKLIDMNRFLLSDPMAQREIYHDKYYAGHLDGQMRRQQTYCSDLLLDFLSLPICFILSAITKYTKEKYKPATTYAEKGRIGRIS